MIKISATATPAAPMCDISFSSQNHNTFQHKLYLCLIIDSGSPFITACFVHTCPACTSCLLVVFPLRVVTICNESTVKTNDDLVYMHVYLQH